MEYSRLNSSVVYIQCGICPPIVEYIRLGEKISVLWVHVCTLYSVEYIRFLDNLIPCIYVPCLFKSFLLQDVEKCNLLCSIFRGGPQDPGGGPKIFLRANARNSGTPLRFGVNPPLRSIYFFLEKFFAPEQVLCSAPVEFFFF